MKQLLLCHYNVKYTYERQMITKNQQKMKLKLRKEKTIYSSVYTYQNRTFWALFSWESKMRTETETLLLFWWVSTIFLYFVLHSLDSWVGVCRAHLVNHWTECCSNYQNVVLLILDSHLILSSHLRISEGMAATIY